MGRKSKNHWGVWGWVSLVFFTLVVLGHAVNGARYIFDPEHRARLQQREASQEAERLARKIGENELRWRLNGCSTPGVCDEFGSRLDGDLSRERLIWEMRRSQ